MDFKIQNIYQRGRARERKQRQWLSEPGMLRGQLLSWQWEDMCANEQLLGVALKKEVLHMTSLPFLKMSTIK